MRSVTLPAYAKVNLHLQVLGKRPDSYHELLTLFERISLTDEVRVEETAGPGIELLCDSEGVPCDGTNLAVRAAELFREACGWRQGIRIRLEKRIPVGGGLGGGSSDAAAVLGALQDLSGRAASPRQLQECARQLGADVAFFAAAVPRALGRGRGDEIEPLQAGGCLWHLLVTPDFPVPTKEVYGAFRLPAEPREAEPLLQALRNGTVSSARELLYNALEPVVEGLYPRIRRVKSEMEAAGLEKPMVSGSGSTVFALCDSKDQARSAGEAIRKRNPAWRIFVTATA